METLKATHFVYYCQLPGTFPFLDFASFRERFPCFERIALCCVCCVVVLDQR